MSVTLLLCAGLALVCVVLFLHPYVLYPLSLHLLKRPQPVLVPAQDAAPPRFSLLFCAYNEMGVMPEKLDNLRALKASYPELEVLAYDDASTDGTWEALTQEPELVQAVRGGGRTGKAHGMKILAARATGDLLVFTDANVIVHRDALGAFAEAYRDERVGGVCGTLVYGAGTGSTAAVGGLYWRLEERVKELESQTGNVMGADGSIFSVRRALYPDFPDSVQDDFTVSMSMIFSGHRLVRRADALASEELVSSSSEEFRRKVRIAARAYHTHQHLSPGVRRMAVVDRYKYLSHKVLRWHSATVLVLGVLGVLGALSTVFGLVGLAAGVLTLAVGAAVVATVTAGPVGQVREILLALIATNWGVWQAIRGKTFVTWQPPPR